MPTTTVTKYYSVNGQIIGEKVGSNPRTDYLTDALGSVTATVDQTAQIVNTYRYKPYGVQLSKTGSGPDPAFRWVGSLGYRQTGLNQSDVYVRARHYGSTAGRWTSVDPMVHEDPYTYVMSRPVSLTDPSGYQWWYPCPDCCDYDGYPSKPPPGWGNCASWTPCSGDFSTSKSACDAAIKGGVSPKDCTDWADVLGKLAAACLGGGAPSDAPDQMYTACCYQARPDSPLGKWKSCDTYCCVADNPHTWTGWKACAAFCLGRHEATHKKQCDYGSISPNDPRDEECAYYVSTMCMADLFKSACPSMPPPTNVGKCLNNDKRKKKCSMWVPK